jgi:Dullard-like phosphatase family protein
LEKRLQLLLDKINKYNECNKECLDIILFFFENHFYEEETKIFKNKHNKKNFLYNIKIEILCFFLCYDISNSKNFNQAAILLKTIFNIIHSNYLILISYLINLYQFNLNSIDNNNLEIMNNFKIIIEKELKTHLLKQDLNEYNILQTITNNSKNINNYYKMLIDNLYGQNNIIEDNNIKFPQCLNNYNYILSQNKFQNVISVFFFDAYRLLTNYDFNDLCEFFNIFLNKKKNNDFINNNTINNNNNEEKIKDEIITYNDYILKNNKIEKYILPKIKRYYKYSLVLDLDETLICVKRDNYNDIKLNKNNLIALIIRPGLIDFLQKMKKLYELILFSSGTSEYVTPIVKNIEKKEKFFEYILYRQHLTFDENGNFFKNLNLLNRNAKNILIVDDNYKNFKYHKLNGICIKPFYGDSYNDKNTLKILGNLLYKIRCDADITGDIRISLNKEKNSITYSQIANNF